jgi:two-component system nitrate/nitrite response regulator NarL
MDGIEATRQIRARCPATRVMALSMFDTHEYIQRVIEGGALGYVLKEEINKDLMAAVRTVYKGNQYFSEKIALIAEQYIHHKGIDRQTH